MVVCHLDLFFLGIAEAGNFPSNNNIPSSGIFNVDSRCRSMIDGADELALFPQLLCECDRGIIICQIQD